MESNQENTVFNKKSLITFITLKGSSGEKDIICADKEPRKIQDTPFKYKKNEKFQSPIYTENVKNSRKK